LGEFRHASSEDFVLVFVLSKAAADFHVSLKDQMTLTIGWTTPQGRKWCIKPLPGCFPRLVPCAFQSLEGNSAVNPLEGTLHFPP
jgi:hypothetical protein